MKLGGQTPPPPFSCSPHPWALLWAQASHRSSGKTEDLMELHVQPGAPPHAVPGSGAVPAQHHRRGLRGRTLCQATGRVPTATGAGWCGGRPWWPALRSLEAAASQSNNLKEGHNSSHGSWAGAVQSSWGHHEELCHAVTSAEVSEEAYFNQIWFFHPRLYRSTGPCCRAGTHELLRSHHTQ